MLQNDRDTVTLCYSQKFQVVRKSDISVHKDICIWKKKMNSKMHLNSDRCKEICLKYTWPSKNKCSKHKPPLFYSQTKLLETSNISAIFMILCSNWKREGRECTPWNVILLSSSEGKIQTNLISIDTFSGSDSISRHQNLIQSQILGRDWRACLYIVSAYCWIHVAREF